MLIYIIWKYSPGDLNIIPFASSFINWTLALMYSIWSLFSMIILDMRGYRCDLWTVDCWRIRDCVLPRRGLFSLKGGFAKIPQYCFLWWAINCWNKNSLRNDIPEALQYDTSTYTAYQTCICFSPEKSWAQGYQHCLIFCYICYSVVTVPTSLTGSPL